MNTNIETQKKRPYNPFRTVVIKMAKVNKVKCFCKAVKQNPKDMFGTKKALGIRYNEKGRVVFYPNGDAYDPTKIYFYEVGANDGSYRKCVTKEEALKRFEQLVEFEKRQTEIK